MARLVGQHAVRDFRSHKKASGAPSQYIDDTFSICLADS
jgi:hypothetical protein